MQGRIIQGHLHWMGRVRFGRGYGKSKLRIGFGTSFGGLPVTLYLPSKIFDIVKCDDLVLQKGVFKVNFDAALFENVGCPGI